jgi:hypothetical protein
MAQSGKTSEVHASAACAVFNTRGTMQIRRAAEDHAMREEPLVHRRTMQRQETVDCPWEKSLNPLHAACPNGRSHGSVASENRVQHVSWFGNAWSHRNTQKTALDILGGPWVVRRRPKLARQGPSPADDGTEEQLTSLRLCGVEISDLTPRATYLAN